MTRRYKHALRVVRFDALDPAMRERVGRLRLEAENARIAASQARSALRRAEWTTVALRFEAELCEVLVGSLQLSN